MQGRGHPGESLIDAMTFWSAGYRNVTAAYGTNGFTEDHLSAFQRYGVERVLIAYDRDDAGERAAGELAERLMAAGLACFRILFPKGMDANAYALKVTPPTQSLRRADQEGGLAGQWQTPSHPERPRLRDRGDRRPIHPGGDRRGFLLSR